MIVDDNALETKKFQMYAEKADTEAKRIELCKKYLDSKGIKTDAYLPAPIPEMIVINKQDVEFLSYRLEIDDNMYYQNATNNMEMERHIRKNIADNLSYEMLVRQMITFDTYKDYARMQTIINGKVGIWRGQ